MKSEQQHEKRYRGRPARRISAVVALALGTALLATPASAVSDRPVARTAQHASVDTAAGPAAAAGDGAARSAAGPAAEVRQADAGDQVLAKEKKKKKKGFFKKLGIALVVILIVVIILVIVAIALIVHFVRKAFRRRRS
ncbi:hypothetical protein [Streptomyces sp. I05A-00742]|uniref:hypothetical protein n=1 Tax=Streptomyces sp. I05A-00742 TaxID=2732853 RepID=UPI00148A01A3|nr:hypothetical protein [Streptomyces sp. I05A-00742]